MGNGGPESIKSHTDRVNILLNLFLWQEESLIPLRLRWFSHSTDKPLGNGCWCAQRIIKCQQPFLWGLPCSLMGKRRSNRKPLVYPHSSCVYVKLTALNRPSCRCRGRWYWTIWVCSTRCPHQHNGLPSAASPPSEAAKDDEGEGN